MNDHTRRIAYCSVSMMMIIIEIQAMIIEKNDFVRSLVYITNSITHVHEQYAETHNYVHIHRRAPEEHCKHTLCYISVYQVHNDMMFPIEYILLGFYILQYFKRSPLNIHFPCFVINCLLY